MDARTVRRRPFWRTVSTIVVVGLLGLTPLSATASDGTAGADETTGGVQVLSLEQCSNAFFCLWSGTGYTSTFTQTVSTSPVGINSTNARSVWNRTGKAVRVYSGTGGTGSSVCYGPNARSGSISITSRSVAVQSGTSC
jgi:hypothetical protein